MQEMGTFFNQDINCAGLQTGWKEKEEKEEDEMFYSKTSTMHTQNTDILVACVNGMPGFDAPNTDLVPADNGTNGRGKGRIGQSPHICRT